MLLAVLSPLLLSACSDPVPAIGRELPRTLAQAAPYFDERIKQRFPVGSDEDRLLVELRKERFSVLETRDPPSHYQRSAVSDHHDLVCREIWRIA